MNRDEAIMALCQHQLGTLSAEERASEIMDVWGIDEDDPDFWTLSADVRAELDSSDSPTAEAAVHERYDPMVLIALAFGYRGVRSEFIASEFRKIRGGALPLIEGSCEVLVRCRVCYFRTLDRRGEYDICTVCGWEDDGVAVPDTHSGPNHMTLRQGRESFARIAAIDQPSADRLRPDRLHRYYR